MDLFLLAGAFVLPLALLAFRREDTTAAARALFLIVFGVYALPVLFGPGCLRMETARCWNWVAGPAMALAAKELLAGPHPRGIRHDAFGSYRPRHAFVRGDYVKPAPPHRRAIEGGLSRAVAGRTQDGLRCAAPRRGAL